MTKHNKRHRSSGDYAKASPCTKQHKMDTSEDNKVDTPPQPPGTSMDDKLSAILNQVSLLPTIQKNLKDLSLSMENMKVELTEHQKAIEFSQAEIEDLKVKNKRQEERIHTLETEVKGYENSKQNLTQVEEKIVNLEAYGRRENLIFENINENQHENCRELILNIMEKELKIQNARANVKLTRVHRLGPPKQAAPKPRPIIARFLYYPDRELVWERKTYLKGTPIVLREDFPEAIMRQRSELFPYMQVARKQGLKATLRGSKLLIEGKLYNTENVQKIIKPRETSERKCITQDGKKLHLFFGAHSPLSNFYPSTFTLHGKTFTCAEQSYQYGKATFVGDDTRAELIANEVIPREVKKIGGQVRVDHKASWGEKGRKIMKDVLLAKFQQNPQHLQYLSGTKGQLLVECNRYDKLWGNGCSLHSSAAENPRRWEGQNLLGTLLEQVRDHLC